jgi:hypothetical protein
MARKSKSKTKIYIKEGGVKALLGLISRTVLELHC